MSLSGCATLSWYGQAVSGQLDLLSRREHIADLLADPSTDPELARRLRHVLAIREFAAAELSLPESRSYRHYADLERSAAVWNVIATGRYSVEPVTWCYPIAGCVAYRGYFDREDALAEARKLGAQGLNGQGLDVIVSPAVAYSTLGWFDDPVLNTMLAWDDAELAGFLFHELAHEAVYVAGDSAFNEAYATVVERSGVERWLQSRSDSAALEAWRSRNRAIADWSALLLSTREQLQSGYADASDEAALADFKAAVFASLSADLAALADTYAADWLRRWSERPLNNADLALLATYRRGIAAFDQLLADCEQDLACFHERVRRLAEESPAKRSDFLNLADT